MVFYIFYVYSYTEFISINSQANTVENSVQKLFSPGKVENYLNQTAVRTDLTLTVLRNNCEKCFFNSLCFRMFSGADTGLLS